MKRHAFGWVLALAIAAFVVTGAVAETLPPIQFEKYELPNGLDVILHRDPTIPMVAVNVWYHVGSKNEERGRTGFAHLFEHMMFQGSQNHDQDYFAPLEKVGGAVNGSTSEDRTNYWENVPSNYLELALWLEADRMGWLLPAMTQEKLDNQRDVVKNERRQGLDNQPYAKSYELMLPMIYPPEHPYSWPVIGSMEDLSAASLDDVGEFFKLYYAPNNASLCVAGDIDIAATKALIEKYFSAIPPGAPVDRMTDWIPRFDGIKRGMAEDNVNLPKLYYAWHTPAYYRPGDAEFDLLANVLSSGKTSRLYKTLVYEKQIAQDISAYQSSGELCGTFQIEATAKEGHTLAELEQAIDEVLRDVLANGITAAELKQAQTQWEASFVRRLERVGGFGGRADKLNEYNVMLGDPGKFQWDMDRYTKTTAADVNRFAKEYIDLSRRVIFHIVPQGELAAKGEEFDRKAQPTAMAEPKFTPPAIQRGKLSNGLEVLVVEDHKLPLVQTNLVLKSGWTSDPADRPGAGSLTAELLDEGTKSRTALQISEEAKTLGASLGTSSFADGSQVSMNCLTKNLDPALALMADVVLNPTFPGEELERQRQQYLGRIQQEAKQPFTSAFKTFLRTLYGPDHPYGQPYTGSGTEQSIKAIQRADLERYYKANYLPNNASVVMVGDITLAEATAKLEKVFKNWQPGTVVAPEIPPASDIPATKVAIVDKPGAAQSVIVVGHLGLPRSAADWMATDVMNNTFGGQFTSRLNMNLREDKGYTYGAGAVFISRKEVGPFIAYAQVKTEDTKNSVVEFLKEMNDIVGPRPLTDQEVIDSKNNLIKSFPQGFETYGSIANQVADMVRYDLPADDWQTYESRVNAIDGAMATKAAKDHLKPNQTLIVIVGDRAKIEDGLRELSLGEVVLLNGSDL